MKLKFFFVLTAITIFTFSAQSRIRSLDDYMNKEDGGFGSFDSIDTSFSDGSQECSPEYQYTSCADGKVLTGRCPYNGDYYRSCECDQKFRYNTSNCPPPSTLAGSTCDGKYESCFCTATCPEGYAATCPNSNEKVNNSCNSAYCFKC